MKRVLSRFVLNYLRFFAKLSLSIHKPIIIGIAGTAGKSSTRNALYAVLKDHFTVKTIHGNSETGVPLGILGVMVKGYQVINWLQMIILAPFGIRYLSNTQYLIAEMGIDEPDPPKNMEYLLSILKPKIALYLNESAVHTMQFEKLAKHKAFKNEKEKLDFLVTKLAEEDAKIITQSGCEVGIYNADDPYVAGQVEIYKQKETLSHRLIGPWPKKLLSFGSSHDADAFYKSYKVSLKGTEFVIHVEGSDITLQFQDFILPKTYQENFAAVTLTALQLGVSPKAIETSLAKNYKLPASRSSILEGIQKSVIIDSSYNASKHATFSFIELLKELKKTEKRPTVFVFGDMREIGSGEDHEHAEIAKSLSDTVDYLYCVGEVTQRVVMPIAQQNSKIKDAKWFENSQKLGAYLAQNLQDSSIVLVKGSQNTIFLEEAIKPLLKNNADTRKLCRQESYWMNIKNEYFKAH